MSRDAGSTNSSAGRIVRFIASPIARVSTAPRPRPVVRVSPPLNAESTPAAGPGIFGRLIYSSSIRPRSCSRSNSATSRINALKAGRWLPR